MNTKRSPSDDLTGKGRRSFAREWIEAWNTHDLERIMWHYAEEVAFTSPFVVKLFGDPSGTVRGKERLRAYFAKGLAAYPDLKFELLEVLAGVESLVVYYRSVKSMLAAEMMIINSQGKIQQVIAHYHG